MSAQDEAPEEKPVLQRSIECRVPTFQQGAIRETKADQLSDHILDATLLRAEVAELRMGTLAQLKGARKQWRELQGWERYKRRSSDRTKEAEFEAKRAMKPELGELIENAEWTIERCDEEMERLDKDATRCNQAWTIIAKG